MITRQQIIDEALTWVGTPYQHQAMCKGYGVDCAMLAAGVSKQLGLLTVDDLKNIPPYPRDWHMHQDFPMLTDSMKAIGCIQKNIEDRLPGDIVVFKIGRVPSHLGILVTQDSMVHAYGNSGQKVVVTPIDDAWLKRMIDVYAYPGVE